jgi:adenine C2-methylase RlmN of 23S rRNA A2503 and tRNA A37
MKPTAVEWQFEQLFNSFEKFNNGEYTFNDYLKRNLEIREQAKAMEKEQHDNTAEEWWKQGAHYMESGGGKWESFEQYYNETFKSE